MDALELQLRRYTRSWPAWTGAAAVTTVIFMGVAVTSVTPEHLEAPYLPPLLLSAAPPSASPIDHPPAPRPVSAPNLAEAFNFDPTTLEKPADIPLGHLDTSAFGGSLKLFDANAGMGFDLPGNGMGNLAVTLGMQRTFDVQKPDSANRIIIFERDQVDEIPVWLYGPQPRIPSQFDRTDWSVLVLYAVSERGKPENIYILDASDPALIAPVKAAIGDWRFRPARKNGKAVKIWVQQPVNYRASFKSPFSL